MFFQLGSRKYKSGYPKEYKAYMEDALRLEKRIYKKIKSISGYRSIKKILRKMMKVHFPDREDVDKLLIKIKRKQFNIFLNN